MDVPAAPGSTLWEWPDALVAAALATCLATVLAVGLVHRSARPLVGGLPVVGGLVVACSVTLLVHDRPVARGVAVGVAALAFLAALVVHRRRRRSGRPVGGPDAIAPDDHRC